MDASCTIPSSAHGSYPENHQRDAHTFVRFWKYNCNAYIRSPNDASLAVILKNGQGTNHRLTFSNKDRRKIAATLAIPAHVAETPSWEPSSTPPTPNAPRPTRHPMRAPNPSPNSPCPFNILAIDPSFFAMSTDMLLLDESDDDGENIYGHEQIDSTTVSSSFFSPTPQFSEQAAQATGSVLDILYPLLSTFRVQPTQWDKYDL